MPDTKLDEKTARPEVTKPRKTKKISKKKRQRRRRTPLKRAVPAEVRLTREVRAALERVMRRMKQELRIAKSGAEERRSLKFELHELNDLHRTLK